jgi:hypothetical protein
MTTGFTIKKSPVRMGLALLAVLAAGPALAGCSDAQVQGAVNGAVQGATDGDVSLGGALPDGWPAEIPVIDGEIKFGAGNTTNGEATARRRRVRARHRKLRERGRRGRCRPEERQLHGHDRRNFRRRAVHGGPRLVPIA